MFRRFRRLLIKLIDDDVLENADRYERLVESLHDASGDLGYNFPTIPIFAGWIISRAVGLQASVDDLGSRLRSLVSPDEDPEIGRRLESALRDRAQTRH